VKYKMTATVEVRVTRPKGKAVHVPWGADKGFTWVSHDDVKLEADTIEHLVRLAQDHTNKLARTWPSDDLEAVKVEGSMKVGWSEVTIRSFADWEENS
jgi:hypothetical protein